MHNQHGWIGRTAEGIKREVRVVKPGGLWRFQSKREDQVGWEYYDRPMLEDLKSFKELLFRKYRLGKDLARTGHKTMMAVNILTAIQTRRNTRRVFIAQRFRRKSLPPPRRESL
jgi:hypothetical protein